jgi:hypothetical protein
MQQPQVMDTSQFQALPPAAATLRLKVIAVRGNFSACSNAGEAIAFFRDAFDLTVYRAPGAAYTHRERTWELLCAEEDYRSRVAEHREHAEYQLGHTVVTFYAEEEDAPQDSVDLLVVVPSTPRGPAVKQQDIVRSFSQEFAGSSLRICRTQSSEDLSCWRASMALSPTAAFSPTSVADRLVLQVDGRDVVVSRHVRIALQNIATGDLLTAETIAAEELEQTVISVFKRSKGAAVELDLSRSEFRCRSVQDLGTLRLGDPQHNTLLIKGVDYRCIESSESALSGSSGVVWIGGPDLLGGGRETPSTPLPVPARAATPDGDGIPLVPEAADLSYLTQQLAQVARLAGSMAERDTVLVLGGDRAASAEAMRFLCTSSQGNWALRWHGATFLSTDLRVNGRAAVAVCDVSGTAPGLRDPELTMCRYYFATVALKRAPLARLLFVLNSPVSVPIDAANLLELPLSLNLTAEQLAACTYWFAPTAGGVTDGVGILNLLRSLLAGSTGEDRIRAILADIVSKGERQGGCTVLADTDGADLSTPAVTSAFRTAPLAVASLTLPAAAAPTECVAKLDAGLQSLAVSVSAASHCGHHSLVAAHIAQLISVRNFLRLPVCDAALAAVAAAARAAVPHLLGELSAQVEGLADTFNGLTIECASGICAFAEALIVAGELPSAQPGSDQTADPVVRAESALELFLAHLRADFQARVPGVAASSPAGLSNFLAPMRLVYALRTVYGSSDCPAAEGVRAVAADFGNELDALATRLQPFFPSEDTQEGYEIPAEATWAAVLLVETVGGFSGYNASALVSSVRGFAAVHVARQLTVIEKTYLSVTDEKSVLTEAGLAERHGAAAQLKQALSYVQSLVGFYEQRTTQPADDVPCASELIKVVFAGDLQTLRDDWLAPGSGTLAAHLAGMREASELTFVRAVRKACVAECLRPLDDLLQPQDSSARADWAGYAKVSADLASVVTGLAHAMTASISEGKYAEAQKFLEACDRSDFAQAAGLEVPLQVLATHVQAKVASAKALAQRLDLREPTADRDVDAVVKAHAALCTLRELLFSSLDQTFEVSATQDITDMQDAAMTAASAHVQVADSAATQGRFAECETALLLVQHLIVGFYGSMHTYGVAMGETDAADRVNVRAVRSKVSAYVKSARDAYDAVFRKTADCFEPAQAPPNQAGDSVGSPLDEGDGAPRAGNHTTATAPFTAANLSAVLASVPPKDIVASLTSASTAAERGFTEGMVKGANKFYDNEAAALRTYLTDQIKTLVALTEDRDHSYDLRLAVLLQLQQTSSNLPEDVWVDLSPAVLQQLKDLKAECASVTQQCATHGESIGSLVNHLSRYTSAREYTYCSLYSAAIAGSVRSAVQKLSGELDAKKTCAVLTGLAAVWPDWSQYLQLCEQLGRDAKYTAVAAASVPTATPTADSALTLAFELAEKLAKQISADFAHAEGLVAGAPGVFPQLEGSVELAIQLYNSFLSSAAPATTKGLLGKLSGAADPKKWINTALAAFFDKAAQLLTCHSDHITAALAVEVIDSNLLNNLLMEFAHSRSVYATLMNFATPSVRASVPAVETLYAKCRSYETVVGDVDRALDAVAAKVTVKLLSGAEVAAAEGHALLAYYARLATSYKCVLQMTVLQPHLSNVPALAEGCTQHLSAQITALRTHLTETVLAQEDAVSEECRKAYNKGYENLSAFRAAFAEHAALAQVAADAAASARRRLMAITARMVDAAAAERHIGGDAPQLLAVNAVASDIPSAGAALETSLNELLGRHHSLLSESALQLRLQSVPVCAERTYLTTMLYLRRVAGNAVAPTEGATGVADSVGALRRQLQGENKCSEAVSCSLDSIQSQLPTLSPAATADALRACLDEVFHRLDAVFHRLDINYLEQQLSGVGRLTNSLQGKEVLLVLGGAPAASVDAIRVLCASSPGVDTLRWHGAAFLSTELRTSGAPAVAICDVLASAEGGSDHELALCRHHFAAVALKRVSSARLLFVLSCHTAAPIDAVKLLELPLSMNLTVEQLAACSYWFAPTAGGVAGGAQILGLLRDHLNTLSGSGGLHTVLADVVAKAERQGGCTVLAGTCNAEANMASLNAALQTVPVAGASLALPFAAASAACVGKLDAQLQGIVRDTTEALSNGQNSAVAANVAQLKRLREYLLLPVCDEALAAALPTSRDAVPDLLRDLTAHVEALVGTGVTTGLTQECAADVCAFIELLMVTGQLPSGPSCTHIVVDTVVKAESALMLYLAHLRADFQARVPGVTASSPAGLLGFLAPMRLVYALRTVYGREQGTTAESVRAVAADFSKELDALAVRLQPFFPGEDAQEGYEIPAEATRAAVLLVETVSSFSGHNASALVYWVKRFATSHAVRLSTAMEQAFFLVTDEKGVLTEADLAQRHTAAAQLETYLSYLQTIVHFHQERSTLPDHSVAAASELIKVVFAGDLQTLRDDWLAPGTGTLAAHLADMREASELTFVRAVRKACVAKCLRPLDDLLQPQDSSARADWVGYAKLSVTLSAVVNGLVASLANTVSEGRYVEAQKFLEACNRSDFAQAARLTEPLNSLAVHVQSVVVNAKAVTERLELSLPTVEQDLEAVVKAHTVLCSLRDHLLAYLATSAQEAFTQGLSSVQDTAIAAAVKHTSVAETAATAGSFEECEAALQLVQRLVTGFYGSLSAYNRAVGGDESAGRVNIRGAREQVGTYVRTAKEAYDAAFSQVVANFASTTPGAPSAAEQLRGALARLSPKEIAASLARAATIADQGVLDGAAKGASKFYKSEAAALCSHLTDQIRALLSLCSDARYSYDLRQDVLAQLQQASNSLPEDVWIDVAPAVAQQMKDLKAECAYVAEQCAVRDQPIGQLLDKLSRYISTREFTYCSLYTTAIAGSVQSAVQKLSGELDAKDTGTVLSAVVALWPEWSRYLQLCAQLKADPAYAAVSAGPGTSTTVAAERAPTQVTELAKKLGARIVADLAGAQALVAGAPGVFSQLGSHADLAIRLYTTFLSASTPSHTEDLLGRLCDATDAKSWLANALSSVFLKAAQLLAHYPDKITATLAVDVVDFRLLNELLTEFALSNDLCTKLMKFATPAVRASFPAVEALCTKGKSYESVVEDVNAAVDSVAAKLKVKLLADTAVPTSFGAARTAFYIDLAASYKHLLQASVLQQHLSRVTALASGCTKHLSAQVAAVQAHLIDTVLRQSNSVTAGSREAYSNWYDNLSTFRTAFAEQTALAQAAAEAAAAAHSRLMAIVTRMIEAAAQERDDAALVRQLVALKAVAEGIAPAKADISCRLNELLDAVKGRGVQVIPRLAVLLNAIVDPTLQEHARMLLKDCTAFEGYQLSLFNTKATRFTFEEVLGRTRAQQLREPKKGESNGHVEAAKDTISVKQMVDQYKLFNDKYRALVQQGLTDLQPAKSRCKAAVQEISQRAGINFVDRVRELMVQLFLYWTLSNSTHYFDNVGGQAAGRAADDSSWMYLKQPHAGQIISIFRMFGIDCGVASEQELQNHFVQIGTGEGKSVILAITSCIFALLGKDVHCVCYSEYLYKRDQADFRPLFEAFNVERSIKYGTFQDLCESYLNRRGDIRDSVQSIVECPTGQAWSRGSAEPANFPADGVPTVLLIDEVDVFFKGEFYGCAYRPTAALRDETVSALLDYVWSCRDGFVPAPGSGNNWGSRHTTLAKFKGSPLCGDCVPEEPLCTSCEGRYRGSPQYHACVTRYPDWEFYIDEAIKQMLGDLKTFRTPKYKYEIIGDRIGYHIQDRIDFKTVDGYKTLFAYYQAAHEGKISAAALKEHKCIRIDCGAYSYAEIPKIYDHLMGVSGTLEALQDAERDILYSAYKVRRLTYTASVYSDATSKLRFNYNDKDVKIGPVGEHSVAIAEQIRARRVVPSEPTLFLPVLVFFKTSAQVEAFEKYLANHRNARIDNAAVQTITEKNTTDKDNLIRLAVRAGTVTLLSRELGRGTDFYVYSDSIDAAGGVVVIQTFLSEDVSEEVQIKGRTARQGNNGSYCLVLSDQDLLTDFSIESSSLASMRKSKTYVSTLSAKRAVRFQDHYEQLAERIAVYAREYGTAMQFIDNLAKVPKGTGGQTAVSEAVRGAILDFLRGRNACPAAPIRLSRTLVLMDATHSMANLLTKAQSSVMDMFTDAQRVLREAGVVDRSFEMQFAVYRNYNSKKAGLFQHYQGWTKTPAVLQAFMGGLTAMDGAGREAIEIGLWHANQLVANRQEGERYQVVLIGDAGPNHADEVVKNRYQASEGHPRYWDDQPYAHVRHFEDELKKLVLEEVPVHTFHIGTHGGVHSSFPDIAKRSSGHNAPLDIHSDAGAVTLKRLITERVLDDVVGGGPEGRRLREIYSRLQQGLQATG